MKRILLTISIGLAAVTQAFGLSGGPFSNDSPLNTGGSGTYQGIASGKNLLGIAFFGFSDGGGSTGRWLFFHEGVQSFGDLQAIVDLPGRQIVGIMDGDTIEGQTKAGGAFDAHIDSTKPILTATGIGQFTSPAIPQSDRTKDITDTVTTISNTGDEATEQVNQQREVARTDSTVQPVRETVPFNISLTRTSLQVASFASE